MSIFKYPSFIQLNLTNKCNLYCKHCFNDSGKSSANELSDNEIIQIMDYFLSKKIVCITFGGGEPLLHKSIFKFIDYGIKRNARITLLTNGLLVNRSTAEKITKHSVDRVRVSLDGSTEKINDFIRSRGSFRGAVKALNNLKKAGLKNIAVMTSVNRHNINDLENIIKLLVSLSIDDVKLIPTIQAGRAKKMFKDYILEKEFVKDLLALRLHLSKKYKNKIYISMDSPLEVLLEKNKERVANYGPCLIGQVFLGIKSNGDIFACPMLDQVIIGNIRKNKIESVWRNSDILQKTRNNGLLKGKCKNCDVNKACNGGCRALAYLFKKDILMPDPCCWR